MVGCWFDFATKGRHGGKQERNFEFLIHFEVDESREINMAVGGGEGDQNNQKTRRSGLKNINSARPGQSVPRRFAGVPAPALPAHRRP